MKTAVLCAISGTLVGIVGGVYLGVRCCARALTEKIYAVGGLGKTLEFYDIIRTKREPD